MLHLAARMSRRRDLNRRHRHFTAFLPKPWGPTELPITFSASAYERGSARLYEQTGVGTGMGGPLLSWCRCRTPDPRARGLGRPYWELYVSPDLRVTLRAAEEAASEAHRIKWEAMRAAGLDPMDELIHRRRRAMEQARAGSTEI